MTKVEPVAQAVRFDRKFWTWIALLALGPQGVNYVASRVQVEALTQQTNVMDKRVVVLETIAVSQSKRDEDFMAFMRSLSKMEANLEAIKDRQDRIESGRK